MSGQPNVIVNSSCGDLVICSSTGNVTHSDYINDGVSIEKFDLVEWAREYPDKNFVDLISIDILDLGYWYTLVGVEPDQLYEPPSSDWRSENKESRSLKETIEELRNTIISLRDPARKLLESQPKRGWWEITSRSGTIRSRSYTTRFVYHAR